MEKTTITGVYGLGNVIHPKRAGEFWSIRGTMPSPRMMGRSVKGSEKGSDGENAVQGSRRQRRA